MKDFKYWAKVDNLLLKFKDGKERYNVQPLFNIIVKQLAEEKNIYVTLDQVLLMHEDLCQEYKKLGEDLMNCKMELSKYKIV